MCAGVRGIKGGGKKGWNQRGRHVLITCKDTLYSVKIATRFDGR